jgi:hypothetical protein
MLPLVSTVAVAGGNSKHERQRASNAEGLEWRMSFLPTVYQDTDVLNIPTFQSEGAAWIKRSKNGVSGRIMSNVATAGDPYTVWIVTINNPGGCATPYACADADLFNPDTQSSAYYGSGAISASNGNGGGVVNIDVAVTTGKLPDDQFVLFGDKPGLHRNNGFGAEIWLVIDIHPNPTPGSWLDDLTTTNPPNPAGPAFNHRIAIFRSVE